MPVDKFGRDSSKDTKTVSSGVSVKYINDNFLRKHGDTMTGSLTIQDTAGVSTILNNRKGISVSGGNIAVGTSAGGPEIDIRQSGEVYTSGLRIRNSDNE